MPQHESRVRPLEWPKREDCPNGFRQDPIKFCASMPVTSQIHSQIPLSFPAMRVPFDRISFGPFERANSMHWDVLRRLHVLALFASASQGLVIPVWPTQLGRESPTESEGCR
jgi:hypothetical protein